MQELLTGKTLPVLKHEATGLWVKFPFSAELIERIGTADQTREKTRENILRLLRDNPQASTAELAATLGITRKGVEWQLRKLKTEGILNRSGPDKGGRWEVLT